MQNHATHSSAAEGCFLLGNRYRDSILLSICFAFAAGVHQTVKLISESFRDSTHATAGTEGGS